MRIQTLHNGLRLVHLNSSLNSVAIQFLVKIGSDYESIPGISHFLEHMVFEGTAKRSSAMLIANEIEKIGGDINAYTTNNRTCYYAKVQKKHALVALDILSDILTNPLIKKDDVQRQRNIIFKEIDISLDEPRMHQWTLFQKALFGKSAPGKPTYGTKSSVKNISRLSLINFFNKYYKPSNMIVSVVGNFPGIKSKLSNLFASKEKDNLYSLKPIPNLKKNVTCKQKRSGSNTYLIIGHKTVPRAHPDSYAIDVIDAHLGRGQSGRLFDTIRNRNGLAYEVGTQHFSETDYGYFTSFLSCNKNDMLKAQKMIFNELRLLGSMNNCNLAQAKTYLEGDFILGNEDTQKLCDDLCFWELANTAKLHESYVKNVNNVTLSDVKRVAKKYFERPFARAIITS